MITHVWSVLCSDATIDTFSNRVSVHKVLDQLNIHGTPSPGGVATRSMVIMGLWMRTDLERPSRGDVRISFQWPSGRLSDPIGLEIDLTVHKRGRNRLEIETLPIEEEGLHTFRVELRNEGESEWKEVAAIPLEVQFLSPPEEETENRSE